MINQARLIEIFVELVKINSPTFKEKKLAEYLIESMMQMGIEAFTDDSYLVTGSDTGNVIGRLPGNTASRPLILNAHMDTIEPTENINVIQDGDIIRTDGNTVLGADCKAGIAVILEVIRIIKENDLNHGPLEIVFTTAEEKGLIGAKNLDYTKLKSKDCIVIDNGGPAGQIIYAAPSQNNLKMIFKGKAAHAGVEPEQGVNAIVAAAQAIKKMKLGRIDEKTTSNVGVIKGGRATNIVPPHCLVLAEARSLNEDVLEDITKSMVCAAEEGAREVGAKAEVEVESLYKRFNINHDQALIRIVELAAKETGIDPRLTYSVGGSDANIFNEKGISAVGISNGSSNIHCNNEMQDISTLYKTALMTLKIVEIFTGESVECFI